MDAKKPIEFNGTAGTYLQLLIMTLLFVYIPLFGWAFILNYSAGWFAQNTRINGQAIAFRAGYLEALKLVTISAILMIITFGIYSIWFVPKLYRYLTAHFYYTEDKVEKLAQIPRLRQHTETPQAG
jgi:uncharacterized membrane protein YjgN (DUF898 family)